MAKAHVRSALAALFLFLFLLPHALAAPVWRSAEAPVTGEVVAVDPVEGSLRVRYPDGAEQVVRLAPGAVVRRNGQASTPWALRPVVPGFHHEVRLWLTADGRARLVEGSYLGTEARVVAVTGGTLTLQLLDGERGVGPETARPLAPGCRVSRSGQWLEPAVLRPGQWVYVLFDREGRAKKIALPG